MEINDKHLKNKRESKDKNEKLMELVAQRLADILITQIEFNKNKNKNEKQKFYYK